MPECVSSWIKYKDPASVAQIQRELIEVYENDFSKHNGKVNSGRILMVFRSIVAQLAKPNEKFIYGAVREGGRARRVEEAIEWLVSAGMLEACLLMFSKMGNACQLLTNLINSNSFSLIQDSSNTWQVLTTLRFC